MKRWLVRIGVAAVVLVAIAVIAGWLASEPRPVGTPGPEAEALARKMETAVGKVAWDSTGAVWWNFGDRHVHLWDRRRQLARVRWGTVEVLLDLSSREGIAKEGGVEVHGDEKQALLEKAYKRWVNDSFWLNPVVKLFDPGTERAIVKQPDGTAALLVTYGAGGVTPGDAYLWFVDETGLPKAWKMWVGIIPIGGLEVSWERWKTLSTGAKVSTLHEGLIPLELKDVMGAERVTAVEQDDPFAPLVSSGPSSQPAGSREEPVEEEGGEENRNDEPEG